MTTRALLTVSRSNPQKLLAIERAQAQRAITILLRAALQRSAENDELRERCALAEGLAAFPTPGMEPNFTTWLDRQDFFEYGLLALYHLNTPQARAILAQHVGATSGGLPPPDYQIERWLAVEYLSKMGAQSYLPIFEKLVDDPVHDVQRSAVFGIGWLGRGKDLDLLARLARNGKTMQDRIDALQAIGESGSLEAVPVLIDLFTLPNADQPVSSNNFLNELTHHEILEASHADLARAQLLWRAWWTQNQQTARAYPPINCDY
ncbi:MAG: HEAT repeat domain-containing protein [Candidatus Eremiobacteraeota bacterium]|nr:HEAT repeat domain-containing protein [Candidatus Eremiobacteraeota bacterium]